MGLEWRKAQSRGFNTFLNVLEMDLPAGRGGARLYSQYLGGGDRRIRVDGQPQLLSEALRNFVRPGFKIKYKK